MSFIHVSVAAVTAEPDHFFVCFRQVSFEGNTFCSLPGSFHITLLCDEHLAQSFLMDALGELLVASLHAIWLMFSLLYCLGKIREFGGTIDGLH